MEKIERNFIYSESAEKDFQIRAIRDEYGEAWFAARDVIKALDVRDAYPLNLIAANESKKFGDKTFLNIGGVITMAMWIGLNQDNSARLEKGLKAKRFLKWVVRELCPMLLVLDLFGVVEER